jgi:hypothetical protein
MSTAEVSWIVTLAPAISGLVGVLLGSALVTLKEWWFSYRLDMRDARFLAVQVVGRLDRYVFACAEVVADDGLSHGQSDEHGYSVAQVELPKFIPEALSVEWRSIPAELMYEILDLPYKAEVAAHIIAGASENADPPDFDDFFEERQLQYASLGLQAAAIASRLRNHAKLPERSIAHWDPIASMADKKLQIEGLRAERARAWQKGFASQSDAERFLEK